MFAHESAGEIYSRRDDLVTSLAERFPKAAELMNEARVDVLAYSFEEASSLRLPPLLTAPLAQDLEHRTRLVGAVLLEQH